MKILRIFLEFRPVVEEKMSFKEISYLELWFRRAKPFVQFKKRVSRRTIP